MKNTSRGFHFLTAVQFTPHSGQGKQLEFQQQLFSFIYCLPFVFLPVTFAIILLVLNSWKKILSGSGLLADCSNASKGTANCPSDATFKQYQNKHNYRLLWYGGLLDDKNTKTHKLKITSEAKYCFCILFKNLSRCTSDYGKRTNIKTTKITGPIHLCYSRMSLKVPPVLEPSRVATTQSVLNKMWEYVELLNVFKLNLRMTPF